MVTDKKPLIEDLFDELKSIGAVSSTDDFSENWLGMNRSYLRCLRARNRAPSARVLAQCANRLQNASYRLTETAETTSVKKVAKRMKQLAQLCADEVFAVSDA